MRRGERPAWGRMDQGPAQQQTEHVPPLPSPEGARRLGQLVWRPGIRRVAVVGTSKNSGKTTTLNALIMDLSSRGERPGLVSIGVDGEARDAWLGSPKPQVLMEKGALIATCEAMARRANLDILQSAGFSTSLGPTVVGRCRSPGAVELAGIDHRAHLSAMVAQLLELGADRVLVDGAYHRQAAAHPDVADCVVAAVGAILGQSADLAVAEAALTLWALTRTPARGFDATGDVGGALSDARIASLMKALRPAVARDPGSILVSSAGRARLERAGVEVQVRRPVPLVAVTTNPHRPGGQDELASRMLQATEALLAALGRPDLTPVDVVADRANRCPKE